MILKNYNIYFFLTILIGISILAWFLVEPFLIPLLMAAILARIFFPLYRFLLRITGGKKGISSLVSCLAVALVIVMPLAFASVMVTDEIRGLIEKASEEKRDFKVIVNSFNEKIVSLPLIKTLAAENMINQESIVSAIKSFSQSALSFLQSAYRGMAHFIFAVFIMFFSLFYLFIDGEKIVRKMIRLSPLKDSYENMLIAKFNSIVRATLKGTLFIALIQGLLSALLFWATGVASPALLGMLTAIVSVIPAVGAFLIWFPVGVVMIVIGYSLEGVTILLFGVLIISTIDNLLRPKLVGRDTEMHPLLILFSTLGGIALFGFSGFLIGPIIMSLFMALWEIYSLEFKTQLEKYNA